MTHANKSTALMVALSLAILLNICACSVVRTSNGQVLNHVVFFRFKDNLSAEAKDRAVRNFLELEGKIPQILSIAGGENINDQNLNHGFTHCFILAFADEEARDIYLPHPEHLRVVEENRPLLEELLVVDFWGR